MRRDEQVNRVARDCVHFKGDRPCAPHGLVGEVCRCEGYCPRSSRVFMVHLSSAAGVVRASALVERLKREDPDCHITFMSEWPELLSGQVDEAIGSDAASLMQVQMSEYDLALNPDVSARSCGVMNIVNAAVKKGFYLKENLPAPIDGDAHDAYLRAILPQSQPSANIDSIRTVFQLCGMEYRYETPSLAQPRLEGAWGYDDEVVIGIYVGADLGMEQKSPWPLAHWTHLVETLEQRGLVPLLLADGAAGRASGKLAESISGVQYPGALRVRELMGLLGRCSVVVTAAEGVSELAAALGKEVVALAGGKIVVPSSPVLRKRNVYVEIPKGGKVLADILPDKVLEAIIEQLGHSKESKITVGAGSFDPSVVRKMINRKRPG